jgi:hypothetical protein
LLVIPDYVIYSVSDIKFFKKASVWPWISLLKVGNTAVETTKCTVGAKKYIPFVKKKYLLSRQDISGPGHASEL